MKRAIQKLDFLTFTCWRVPSATNKKCKLGQMKKFLLIVLFLLSLSHLFAQTEPELSPEEKAKREKNIQAGNPFKRFGYTPKIATLSKGKYLEFHDLDSVVRIGSFSYHVKNREIVGYTAYDTIYPESTLRPELMSRWISPDPLSEEFPSWSPYVYTADNPIRFIDPDGRYFIVKDEEQQKQMITALATAFNGKTDAFSFDKNGQLSINKDKLGELNNDQQFLFDSFNNDIVNNDKNDLVVQTSDGLTQVNYEQNDKGGVTGTISLNINQSDFNDKMRDTSDGTVNGNPNYNATNEEKTATATYHEVGHFREDVVYMNNRDSESNKQKRAVGYENVYRRIVNFNERVGNLHGIKKDGEYVKKYQGNLPPTGYKSK